MLASASLLFVTIIWGSAFVCDEKFDGRDHTYIPFGVPVYDRGAWDGGSFLETDPGMSMQEFKCGALAGLFLFISYYFQTYGLKYTTASKMRLLRRCMW